jgi:hypothetical protein
LGPELMLRNRPVVESHDAKERAQRLASSAKRATTV